MTFTPKFFDPLGNGGVRTSDGSIAFKYGSKQEEVYIYHPKIVLALNVALATKRPLLVSGEPGSGKSTLARSAAAVLGRAYYERVITSRTQAADLLWTFDALGRLSDATAGAHVRRLKPASGYIEPGPLWWAFDPRGAAKLRGNKRFLKSNTATSRSFEPDAVLLLDEVDKADPDVPNDLLEPFGSNSFTVRETGEQIAAKRNVLLILTTNGERELPLAFLRRCVVVATEPPTKEWFTEVATRKFGNDNSGLYERIAERVMALRQAAKTAGQRPSGTSEFLDAVEACRAIKFR
jgi:MoxR-like ATPase